MVPLMLRRPMTLAVEMTVVMTVMMVASETAAEKQAGRAVKGRRIRIRWRRVIG